MIAYRKMQFPTVFFAQPTLIMVHNSEGWSWYFMNKVKVSNFQQNSDKPKRL